MPAAVATISPGQGRPGDLVTINGTGFSSVASRNQVTFDGIAAGVNSETATALEVVIPVGISADQHIEFLVENLDDPGSASWYWWSKDTIANTDAMVLRTKIPWRDEKARGLGRTIKDMTVAEARFFERIATKIELVRDLLAAKGNFFSMSGEELGLRKALAGTAGQAFVSGVDDTGGQFKDRQNTTLQWGVLLDLTAPTLARLAVAGGRDNTQEEISNATTKNTAPFTGQIALVSMRERLSITSRVTKIEVLVNGVVVIDLQAGDPDFPGPGIRNGESLTFYPGTRIVKGDLVQARATRNNTTTDCFVLVYVLVV